MTPAENKPEHKSLDTLSIAGIIGGVGPQAGLDFIQKILSNTQALRDQDHVNCMLISCPSIIPDRTAFLLKDKQEESLNPAFGMFDCAKRLHAAGARFAAVACNTAHAGQIFGPFCGLVKKSLPDLTIVNMLETCALFSKEVLKIKHLGLLATIGTHKSRVYHEYFRKEDGFLLIEPDAAGQEKVHDAIYNEEYGIKAHSQKISSRAVEQISNELHGLADRGAKAVILGCTELPLAVQNLSFPVPLIDPGLILARRLIELAAPEKLRAL